VIEREIIEAPDLVLSGDSEFSKALVGQIIREIERVPESEGRLEELIFRLVNGREFRMNHNQDCCEQVYIESIVGDLTDLLGTPILAADERESSGEGDPPDAHVERHDESYTWTFYLLRTIKGSVTIRWLGESNGYYSESVGFAEITGHKKRH
jgi:hypothetical protein